MLCPDNNLDGTMECVESRIEEEWIPKDGDEYHYIYLIAVYECPKCYKRITTQTKILW